uniref:Uncharacterized protein n=1 Tax=Timema douglasi TaxID=61478 RepID=A0A7R8ZHQ7_TIMDO|nr:unnamed protein product [Timema douglasi]
MTCFLLIMKFVNLRGSIFHMTQKKIIDFANFYNIVGIIYKYCIYLNQRPDFPPNLLH